MLWNGFQKRKNYLVKSSQEIPKVMNMREIKEGIQPFANQLESLINTIRALQSGRGKLDITHGSMASQTAEAVFNTLTTGIDFVNAYFQHMGEENLLEQMKSKCFTTRLVECFFGHMTTNVQGNNMRWLEMKRRIANDAFTFLLPHINSSDSGVSIRSEKDRVAETYSYTHDDLVIENVSLIWQFREKQQTDLLSISQKGELKKKAVGYAGDRPSLKGNYCFGNVDESFDYMERINVDVNDDE